MHVCQIDPTDNAPPCSEPPHQACVRATGEHFEAGNLSAPISPLLTGMCGWCDYLLPFLDPKGLRC